MFASAMPVGPMLAFFNTILQLNLDARKYLVQQKRPISQMASSIGSWKILLGAFRNFIKTGKFDFEKSIFKNKTL